MTMIPRTRARLLLLLTVTIWGSSFVLVKSALADASPMLFNFLRMTLAAAVLIAVNHRALRNVTRKQVRAGVLAGLFLAIGYQFQTLGLARTTAAKSAFITGLVVVLVPLLCLIPWLRLNGHSSSQWLAGIGAALAFAGLILLTTPAGTSTGALLAGIGRGDLLTLVCAFAFALHLLTLARVSPGVNSGLLATLQISTAAVVMLVTLPLEPGLHARLTPRLLLALGLTSVLSTAVAFTIQTYAQRHLQPTETSVILTLEPVIAAVTSILLLGEHLSSRALAGAGLILCSIALVEFAPGLMHARELPA